MVLEYPHHHRKYSLFHNGACKPVTMQTCHRTSKWTCPPSRLLWRTGLLSVGKKRRATNLMKVLQKCTVHWWINETDWTYTGALLSCEYFDFNANLGALYTVANRENSCVLGNKYTVLVWATILEKQLYHYISICTIFHFNIANLKSAWMKCKVKLGCCKCVGQDEMSILS